jgi:hypothetical protein
MVRLPGLQAFSLLFRRMKRSFVRILEGKMLENHEDTKSPQDVVYPRGCSCSGKRVERISLRRVSGNGEPFGSHGHFNVSTLGAARNVSCSSLRSSATVAAWAGDWARLVYSCGSVSWS